MKDKPVILVVDDEQKNIELLEAYLVPQGYEVVKAAAGLEALKILSAGNVDLVLLDALMPAMSGFEVLAKIRSEKKTSLIPVVIITALKEKEDRIKAFEAGCDDFVSKPYDKYELLARVKSLLRIKFLHDEANSTRQINELREELLHVTRVGKMAEFVSSLAHEISQPLTAILSYAQACLRMRSGKDPELEKILSYIVEDDLRAAGIIQQLRSMLKKSKPEILPLDINSLINATVLLVATDAVVKNISIELESTADMPLVSVDRIQLQQVLLNLISNGFEAMRDLPGPHELLIRTAKKDAGTILISLKDSGCGIPEENIPKLFTHFFTSKPDGLGMGLSISRSIVESYGGTLKAKNNSKHGATFIITIPVVPSLKA